MPYDCYGVEIVEDKAYIEFIGDKDLPSSIIRSYSFIGTIKECEEYADKKEKNKIYMKL